jgi:hypothetical protein
VTPVERLQQELATPARPVPSCACRRRVAGRGDVWLVEVEADAVRVSTLERGRRQTWFEGPDEQAAAAWLRPRC